MNERKSSLLRLSFAALVPILLATVGCQSYTELPFNPGEMLKAIKAERERVKAGPRLTFAEATKLMDAGNGDLKELRAEYAKLKAVADNKTPLPNPELEVGAVVGHRMDPSDISKTQPFAALGFSIPLGPRLKREDGLNAVKAETARLAVVARHRELFLELRAAFAAHSFAAQRLQQRKMMSALINQGELTSERLAKAGQIGNLELNQSKILSRLEGLGQIDDEMAANEAATTLAELVGASPASVAKKQVDSLPELPAKLGAVADLEKALVQNNTMLSELRMAFWESDAELKLELAKQYPDLNFGLGFEQEPGEKAQVFEIGIGLELPVFGRNKQGIAQALAARKAARAAYKAELARLLTKLESGLKNYQLNRKKSQAMKELLPLAAKNQQDAHKLTNLGNFDFMRYLDVSRAYTELAMASVEQQSLAWGSLAELEQIIGKPLVQFPSLEANKLPDQKPERKTR